MSVRQALAQRFPGMEVVGSQYPVTPYKVGQVAWQLADCEASPRSMQALKCA